MKDLNSHLASQWLSGVMSWGGKEGIVTSLFTSYGPNTNHAPTLSSMNTLPSGSSQSIGGQGVKGNGLSL